MNTPRRHLSGLFLLMAATPAAAVDGVLFNAGLGAKGISPHNEGTVIRLGAVWDWQRRWPQGNGWTLSGQWEVTAGTLAEDDDGRSNVAEVVDIGGSATFRLARYGDNSGGAYLELGTGPHYLSETQLDGVDVSTHLQFGSHLGVGARFGEGARYELGYRIMHLSNAGIDEPNPGLNYHMAHFVYRY